MSDHHIVIKFVVQNEELNFQPPYAYHMYCIQHIASNFNHQFKNAKQKNVGQVRYVTWFNYNIIYEYY